MADKCQGNFTLDCQMLSPTSSSHFTVKTTPAGNKGKNDHKGKCIRPKETSRRSDKLTSNLIFTKIEHLGVVRSHQKPITHADKRSSLLNSSRKTRKPGQNLHIGKNLYPQNSRFQRRSTAPMFKMCKVYFLKLHKENNENYKQKTTSTKDGKHAVSAIIHSRAKITLNCKRRFRNDKVGISSSQNANL